MYGSMGSYGMPEDQQQAPQQGQGLGNTLQTLAMMGGMNQASSPYDRPQQTNALDQMTAQNQQANQQSQQSNQQGASSTLSGLASIISLFA